MHRPAKQSFARQGAAYECGLKDVTGELRSGLDADLVAFPGNPLQDLSVLSQPVFVMVRLICRKFAE